MGFFHSRNSLCTTPTIYGVLSIVFTTPTPTHPTLTLLVITYTQHTHPHPPHTHTPHVHVNSGQGPFHVWPSCLRGHQSDHELNECDFKNKVSGSITREDYRRHEKVHTSLDFVSTTLTGSYQGSEENNDKLRSTDRFLVKHGVETVCVHCVTDLSS
jgi:hypothetical protein